MTDLLLNANKIGSITDLLEKSKHIAIMPSKVAGADSYCAAAGLYLALKNKELPVTFVYTGPAPEGCEGILKDDEVMFDVSKRELEVSIDYSGTNAAKVHYATENDVLLLTIGPVNKDFNTKDRVKTDIKGFDFDTIFTVGTQSLEDFGGVYEDLKEEFKSAQIVNIDNTDKNQNFGHLNIIDTSEMNLSLLVLNRLGEWKIKLDGRAAKALLTGVTYRLLQ